VEVELMTFLYVLETINARRPKDGQSRQSRKRFADIIPRQVHLSFSPLPSSHPLFLSFLRFLSSVVPFLLFVLTF
jgi:hypothetical protein